MTKLVVSLCLSGYLYNCPSVLPVYPKQFLQNTHRPDRSFESFEDYVIRGTKLVEDGLHGHFIFDTDGERHPEFIFETNKFARFDYSEGKRKPDHLHVNQKE